MFHIGYYEHYLELKRKFPQFKFSYPRDWSLKEYGALFIYDLIKSKQPKRVLEMGCGYDTFFSKEMAHLGVEHWSIDKSNNYLGIGMDSDRYQSVLRERILNGSTVVDGLVGDELTDLPSDYFDMVFSTSVIEHIDDAVMTAVVEHIKKILCTGGQSVHSVDIYFGSSKAAQWHASTKRVGFDVPLPYYDKWNFGGKYTTFIEQPKIRYLIYNSLSYKDPLKEEAPYVSQFATMLCVANKPPES